MSNKSESSTEEVKFRHQTKVGKWIMERFEKEMKKNRWKPAELLRVILEDRYERSES